ncbi:MULTISPECIES: hypothetical protein [Pseudomonas]|uniref:Uncharacterized protein n=1 Tax=Pseudomonas chlororaphis subsp. aureofaciens TaxID=587851 RepID=A0AAD0ZBQ7_9PSED|nr:MULTISPECIES: hypothetical protein [Pseudomonas]AZE22010.1 hypothetical protein C4K08_1568 [Pseudomonas chlororaphis subsp. aureofaciens]AZE28361.1 hypothetical protein C4K07_1561 [Pseudomonas chlororaphis subsp. aureofaciens]AZE34608.1 hypothetical protein C4K06_1560 [Pseudomonas chlororaphis subsp. aureofaciens]AZE40941.1 hypothetical protein C4K05_1586 [Pseudomonas chlororaphis subsp. aureofaciens]POA65002.1 hypothetical protein C1888_25770 [Pseudomonas sp. GW531-T4]
MDRKTNDLLNSIPEHADYAADAGDLDPEDIPQERMDAVMDLLRHADNDVVRFLAAKLLTSWGVHEGLIALEKNMERPEIIEGIYSHRLHGYDDTYRQILMAVTMYFANMADRGEREVARTQVYSPLSKIIALAGSKPFEIADAFAFVKRERYLEYVLPIKQHLVSIIDHPEIHRWKIYDAIELLMGFDPEFVMSLLKEKNKTIDDFRPTVQG